MKLRDFVERRMKMRLVTPADLSLDLSRVGVSKFTVMLPLMLR
jgi:hypothetical protein